MKLVHLCAAVAFPMAIFAAACGGGGGSTSSSSTSSTNPDALHGAYVPIGDSVASAEYRALVFTSDSDYFSYKNNCTGSACRAEGTYTFDGSTTLELHTSTGETESLPFKALETAAGGNSIIGGLIMSGSPVVNNGSPVVMSGSGLLPGSGSILGDGGSLLSQIISALINGALMGLMGSGSGDDGGSDGTSSGSGLFCDPVAAATDCAAQGGNQVTIGADGSCTCTVVVDAGAPVDAAPPVSTPVDAGTDASDSGT
jgi:hypothetical protein